MNGQNPSYSWELLVIYLIYTLCFCFFFLYKWFTLENCQYHYFICYVPSVVPYNVLSKQTGCYYIGNMEVAFPPCDCISSVILTRNEALQFKKMKRKKWIPAKEALKNYNHGTYIMVIIMIRRILCTSTRERVSRHMYSIFLTALAQAQAMSHRVMLRN